jgi:hypothetical protein
MIRRTASSTQVPVQEGAARRSLRAFGWIFLLLCLCWVLYWVIADYSYGAVSGTYKADVGGTTSILHLHADRTFEQDTVQGGERLQARGTWRRIGEGRVVFSKEFLRVNGESVRADGQVDGVVEKIFGLFFTIRINPDPGGRVFYKRPFQFR